MTDDPGRPVPPHGSGPTDVIRPSAADLAALREASEGATKGPWAASADRIYRDDADWTPFAGVFNGTEDDAAFIALSANFTRAVLDRDPATLRAILADAPVEMLAGALLRHVEAMPNTYEARPIRAACEAVNVMGQQRYPRTQHYATVAFLRALAQPEEDRT